MKHIFTVLGFISLSVGSVGIIVPMLPTTPFLLLSALCFAKSSDKINNWFKGTKIYRENLETLAKKQGMTKIAKLRVISTITLLFAIAAFFMRESVVGLIVIGAIWMAHFIVFVFIVGTIKE